MILKCYFDGGNQADSTQYDVVTLASVSGITEDLRPFEADWKAALKNHKASWLHTTDLVSLVREPFTNKHGWTAADSAAFIMDCVQVISAHVARPLTDHSPRIGLFPVTVTIALKDYIRARDENPEVPKTATEICATQNLARCFELGRDVMGANFYHLFFDQNEPFRGHICDRQRSPKALKQLPLLDRITRNDEADMRTQPALQMADLFAWCVSHKSTVQQKWHEAVLLIPRMEEWIGYADLVKPISGVAQLVGSWKLPKRKPTR